MNLPATAPGGHRVLLGSNSSVASRRSPSAWFPGRALRRIIALTALATIAPSSVFAANPAEEMTKLGSAGTTATTGGVDPHGNSWLSIQNSMMQFGHQGFLLRLFLSFSLAVACAWIIAWHPRRALIADPLSDIEERKALIILGMVGAIVAELSGSNQNLAFVIFGIGALLRFRTVLDNPKLTGKAITVVVIGLACGMGSWAMAVFVTAFSWCLIFILESHVGCRIKIRLDDDADAQAVYGMAQSLLVAHRCRLKNSALYENKRQMVFFLLIPAGLDPHQLEADLRSKLPKSDESEITIQSA
jgi:hypothetical protein